MTSHDPDASHGDGSVLQDALPGESVACFPTAAETAAVAAAMDGRRVALVQEWISSPLAGSEKVFQAICRLFVECDTTIFTLVDERNRPASDPGPVRQSFLAKRPFDSLPRSAQLPLMPAAWRSVAGRQHFDVAMISSHAMATRFARHADLALCYCHSPMRYAWLPEIDQRSRWTQALRPAFAVARHMDQRAAGNVDHFFANSTEVRDRIGRFYARDATVLHPPIDTSFFCPDDSVPRDIPLLAVGRLVPYKRHDLAIEVAAHTGRALTVAGRGPMLGGLRSLATDLGADVTFIEGPSDRELRDLYRRAQVLINPAFEDFGMMTVEAIACGCPVVSITAGGARDIISVSTGQLVELPDIVPLAAAAIAVADHVRSVEDLTDAAEAFSYRRFFRDLTAIMKGVH